MRSCLLLILSMLLGVALATVSYAAEEGEIEALKQEIRDVQRRSEVQIEEIRRQNRQQIEELQRRIDELEAKQERMPERMPEEVKGWRDDVELGYKKGVYIKTKDDNWLLKFNTRLQFRFFIEEFDDERDEETDASFQLRRARLYFSGNGFYPWLKYKIELDGDRGDDLSFKDYYLDFAHYEEATPRLGQYKVPFNLEEITSSSVLQFVDRSISNEEFRLARDIGLMLHGRVFGDKFYYGAGIFNGGGRNIGENADNDFLFVGRAEFYPLQYFEYSQAHLEKHPERPLLRIGAAVAGLPGFEPGKETTSDRENLGNAVSDLGSDKADVVQFSADAAFKYRGLSLEAEYNLRRISPDEGSIDDVTAHGLRAQAGYFLIPEHFEVAFRYSFVEPNDDEGDDLRQEFTPALSYYVFGHRLKLQADYSALLEDNTDGGDFTDHRFRWQMQFYF